jgi:hypothetical protein
MRGFVQLEPFGDGFTYGSKLENGFGLFRDAIRVACTLECHGQCHFILHAQPPMAESASFLKYHMAMRGDRISCS